MEEAKIKFDIHKIWELLLLGGAHKAGIFKALKEGSLPLIKLGEMIGANQRSLWTVVEALIESGYLVGDESGVAIDPDLAVMLFDQESPKFTGFSFMHGYGLCERWLNLPEVIKTGLPVRRERKGEDTKNFIASMANSARRSGGPIAADCLNGLGESPAVLDAGGGPLAYAREFTSLGARVTVLDLPEVVEISRPLLKENENIKMVPGDMTVCLPEGPFDLVYLGNVCHIFDEDINKKIFGMANNVLRPGGRIAIQDFIRGESPGGALFAVNMLINTPSGGVWTMQQYSRWLTEAGFGNIELKSFGERHLLKAVKI